MFVSKYLTVECSYSALNIYKSSFIVISEPPEKVVVVNDQGLEASGVIGPYAVGERVKLRCDVMGGT